MRLARLLNLRSAHRSDQDDRSNQAMRTQWDALRRNATTPAERSEIDAMFSRSMP